VVELGRPRIEAADGTSRVVGEVGDGEVFFESADVALSAPPELFASALVPAVVQRRWKLRMGDPLDPAWVDGVEGILRTWAEWWDTPAELGEVLEAPVGEPAPVDRAERTGLCFTAGLDAFHTLLCSGRRIDDLVFAHGYDIPLDDTARFDAAARSIREVAAATGTRAIIVRTNLRRHRPFKGAGWGRTHGGALAALGHACSGEIGELVISSTYPRSSESDWGSSWDTDPGWSSSRLAVSHFGEAFRRDEKLRAVVHNPLVRRHIRVCWENRAATGNCGECEKCVRVMVQVHLLGEDLEDWPFGGDGSLVQRIDGVESINPRHVPGYLPLIELCEDHELRAAMQRLVERAYDPFEDRARRVREREADPGP
jgi:hypothetical protein